MAPLDLVTCPGCGARAAPMCDDFGHDAGCYCPSCDREFLDMPDDVQFAALVQVLRLLGVIAAIVILWGILT